MVTRTGRPRSFDDRQVVDGAKDIFWRRGYAATSMRDLKEELGVLPGSLYGAFGDKHTLFIRALERYADGTRAAAALLPHSPVLPRLRELLTDVLTAAHVAPGRGCMLGNTAAHLLPGDDAAGRVVRDAFRELESAIEQALELAQRTGEVADNIDCGAQARLLVTVMQGLHVLARAELDPQRLEDVIDAALKPLASAPRRRPTKAK
ncbi:MAG TPA: TetR/AcrR family transcriptional regulator [Solirubrobacteraceae bacterium]|jgi:TetR/AcrR family transcriptional repressor of nem operon